MNKNILAIIVLLCIAGYSLCRVFTLNALPISAVYASRNKGTNNDAPKICAILNWVVQTNWADAGASRTLLGWSGGPDPNVTTYYETGTTLSNLIARFDWKGESRGIVLESVVVGITNRAYTLSEQRNYK